MKFIQMSLAASTIVLFTACGGVDSLVEDIIDDEVESYVPPAYTGQFVDTYVKGLNYTCTGKVWDADGQETADTRTTSGVTNEKGEFTCAEGDEVEFSIGSYVIGSTTAYDNPIVTPYEIGLGGTEAVINVAQLLQTIDDGSTDGVLTIPDNFTALDGVTVTPQDTDFDALMADTLNVPSLVSEEEAQAHLDETISELTGATTTPEPTPTTNPITQAMLDGKTFYIYESDAQYSEEIYAKMTLSGGVLTRTEVINGGAPDTFTVPYELIDGKIRIDVPAFEGDGDPAAYIWWTLLSETADSWTILDEEDEYKDGSIDFSVDNVLYLSKPAGYPASL